MDYSHLLEELEQASLFDLYRLHVAIGHQLDDPKRILAIRRQLKPGQEITYFDDRENRLVKATVISLKRTRLLVESCHDGQQWNIPFHFVNLEGVDTDIKPSSRQGLDRNQLKVGDQVGFHDRQNYERYGEIIRLNQKTATLLVDRTTKWRVAYSLLFPIIEGRRGGDSKLIEETIVGRE
jgi:hypothetical protein